jgi:hypothetical protein
VDETEQILRRAYEAFNARDVEAAIALLDPEVDWPNGMEGGRERGHAAVRAYWHRQFGMVDSEALPQSFSTADDGRTVVEVAQRVRDLDGKLISEGVVEHVYTLRDGLVTHMEIRET